MMVTPKYGQLNSEKLAEEKLICRQIIKEIHAFGINQRQHLMLIYLLALELENAEYMLSITSLIKELETDAFVSDQT